MAHGARLLDERDDPHRALAVRAGRRVGCEDLLEKARPGAASRLRAGGVVGERDVTEGRLLHPLASPAIALNAGLPCGGPDRVVSAIRNMAGDGGKEVRRVADLDNHAGGHPARIPEQSPIVADADAQHPGDREHDLAVGDRPQNR